MFQIIDIGLADPNEIVRSELVRSLLINFVIEGFNNSNYINYMLLRIRLSFVKRLVQFGTAKINLIL
jgi:hypothetical protein